MSKSTHGGSDLPSTVSIRSTLFAKAKEKGGDPAALAGAMVGTLANVVDDVALALGGDERVQAHLEAQFKLGKFSSEAQGFVTTKAWVDALVETLGEIAVKTVSVLAEAAIKGLVGALESGRGSAA